METLHTWWATELYPMRERDQFGVSGEFEVVLAADAQATIAALQVDKEDAQDANRLLRRELDKLREKYDAECVMSEGLQSHLTQRTVELHETQNHLADADNEVEQLRKQLSERTAELEAASKAIAEWRKEIDSVLDKLDGREGDVVALQAELERVRALIKALPKVEGDWTVSCALAVTVVTGGIVRDISEVVAAIVQHRQGMEG